MLIRIIALEVAFELWTSRALKLLKHKSSGETVIIYPDYLGIIDLEVVTTF